MFGAGAADWGKVFAAEGATTEGLATLERRAARSMVLVAISGCFRVASSGWQAFSDDTSAESMSFGLALFTLVDLAVRLVATIAFLRWLHRAVACAHALLPENLVPSFQPSSAVFAFFIPVYNMWVPYENVSTLSIGLAPDLLHEPQAEPEPAPIGEYRASGRQPPPPATRWPETAPVLSWWLTWLASGLVMLIANRSSGSASVTFWALGALLTGAAAVLAIVMVRSIALRIRELARRRSVPLPKVPFYALERFRQAAPRQARVSGRGAAGQEAARSGLREGRCDELTLFRADREKNAADVLVNVEDVSSPDGAHQARQHATLEGGGEADPLEHRVIRRAKLQEIGQDRAEPAAYIRVRRRGVGGHPGDEHDRLFVFCRRAFDHRDDVVHVGHRGLPPDTDDDSVA